VAVGTGGEVLAVLAHAPALVLPVNVHGQPVIEINKKKIGAY
jgi:hypothetical protein